MKVLVACEESQAVTKEFRAIGHEAYSCDIKNCTGVHPEWHIVGDAVAVAYDGSWDLMIAHPPCTYLAVSGLRWLTNPDGTRNDERYAAQDDALNFVSALMDAPIPMIAIENPVSVISGRIRKADQVVQPYHFGDKARKATCLWLKNLPPLQPTNIVEPEYYESSTGKRYDKWWWDTCLIQDLTERAAVRSKTFAGIAKAMAQQWGGIGIREQTTFFNNQARVYRESATMFQSKDKEG